MNGMESLVNTLALERAVHERFGVPTDISSVILSRAAVSRTAEATVFLTKKRQLLVYLEASAPLVLADVQKMIRRMGLRAELYFPPKGQPQYFEEIARQKFMAVFPGRTQASSEDLMFYRTLAPYNPALVLIAEVRNGEIYQFDADARGQWRVGARFHYRRIRTS